MSFSSLGNDLYTGKRSIPVVPRRRVAYSTSAVLILLALTGLLGRGLNLGLEFTGGSEFRVVTTSAPADYERVARTAVGSAENARGVNVTKLGAGTVRLQTERVSDAESARIRAQLSSAFDVAEANVSSTFIGPSWGESVSQQALRALIIFLALIALVLSVYFRTWKMSAAALVALGHDMVVIVGFYSWTGFEISPATLIGFLTVLGYSLYDTVVVFDKVRENTTEAFATGRMSFASAANLAVNQTFVRSINTTVVGGLPILAVLVVGAIFLGPGVLLDVSLVLFVGVVFGAMSSIFIATPLLVTLRSKEPRIVELAARAARSDARREREVTASARSLQGGPPAVPPAPPGLDGGPAGSGADEASPAGTATTPVDGGRGTLTGRAVHKYAQAGPRNQPRRTPKSRR